MTASDIPYTPATQTAIRPGHALAVAGALMPTLAIFAYKGLAPLFFIVAVAELCLYWRENRCLPSASTLAALLFAAFVIWGVIGMAWSLDAWASLATAAKIALMAALGLPLLSASQDLDPIRRRLVMQASLGGLVVGLGFMAIEVFANLPITRFLYAGLHISHPIFPSMLDPAATVLVLVSAYVTGESLSRRHFGLAVAIGIVAVALAVLSQSMAAGLAGLLAIPMLIAVYCGGAPIGRAMAVIAAAAIMAAPLLPTRVLGPVKEFNWSADAIPSVYQRIAIWEFAEQRIDERPILGWGLDAARRIPGGHNGIKAGSLHIQNPVMRERVTKYFDSGNIEQMPLHPHDGALQIWLEAGAVGAALAAVLVLSALFAVARRWPADRIGTAATLAFALAALVIAGISYGIWQTWWLATLFLGATFSNMLLAKDPAG